MNSTHFNSSSNMCLQVLGNDTNANGTCVGNNTFGHDFEFKDIGACVSPLQAFEELKVVLMLFYIVVMVLAILGNTLIIHIVFSNKSIRTSTNIFIVNLAVCDLGIPFFVLPMKISELAVAFEWLIPGDVGLALCKVVPFTSYVFVDCSTFSLLLITFDRFCAVLLPHKRHWLSTKVVIILISFTWLLAISINAVFLRMLHIESFGQIMFCAVIWSSHLAGYLAFQITLMCTNIIAPIVLITAAYSAIFFKLKKQVLILGDSISDQLRRQEYLRQKKIVKMAFAIVCAFAVCWLPVALTIIIRIYFIYQDIQHPCWFNVFSEVSSYFSVLISVTNPAICFIFGMIFKEELCKICRRIFCADRCSFSRNVEVIDAESENNFLSDTYSK